MYVFFTSYFWWIFLQGIAYGIPSLCSLTTNIASRIACCLLLYAFSSYCDIPTPPACAWSFIWGSSLFKKASIISVFRIKRGMISWLIRWTSSFSKEIRSFAFFPLSGYLVVRKESSTIPDDRCFSTEASEPPRALLPGWRGVLDPSLSSNLENLCRKDAAIFTWFSAFSKI